MKSFISVLLSIVTLITSFVYSIVNKTNHQNEESPTHVTDENNICGGWNAATEFTSPKIPKNAELAFDKATESITGASYEPVAYLGSQIVSGTKYAFLCKITTVTANPTSSINVVIVYNDLSNNAAIVNTKKVKVTDYTNNKEIDFNEYDGGWNYDVAVGGKINFNIQNAFDKAVDGLTGVRYEPVVQLGSQIVAGTNYAILCKATSVTANPVTKLAVLIIYADLKNNAEITSICEFNI